MAQRVIVLIASAVVTLAWVGRNKLPLRLIPSNTDLMEMIRSATEAQAYKKIMGQ